MQNLKSWFLWLISKHISIFLESLSWNPYLGTFFPAEVHVPTPSKQLLNFVDAPAEHMIWDKFVMFKTDWQKKIHIDRLGCSLLIVFFFFFLQPQRVSYACRQPKFVVRRRQRHQMRAMSEQVAQRRCIWTRNVCFWHCSLLCLSWPNKFQLFWRDWEGNQWICSSQSDCEIPTNTDRALCMQNCYSNWNYPLWLRRLYSSFLVKWAGFLQKIMTLRHAHEKRIVSNIRLLCLAPRSDSHWNNKHLLSPLRWWRNAL